MYIASYTQKQKTDFEHKIAYSNVIVVTIWVKVCLNHTHGCPWDCVYCIENWKYSVFVALVVRYDWYINGDRLHWAWLCSTMLVKQSYLPSVEFTIYRPNCITWNLPIANHANTAGNIKGCLDQKHAIPSEYICICNIAKQNDEGFVLIIRIIRQTGNVGC